VYCSKQCYLDQRPAVMSAVRRCLPPEEVVLAQAENKKCETCKRRKPFAEFTKLASAKDGLSHKCKPCKKKIADAYYKRNRELLRRRQAEWALNNPEKVKSNRCKDYARHREERLKGQRTIRVMRYGITLEAYQEMEDKQGHLCAICRQPPEKLNGRQKSLNVDHDHVSGKVRGLLCTRCNTGIGLFLDSPALLSAAIGYLAATTTEHTDGGDVNEAKGVHRVPDIETGHSGWTDAERETSGCRDVEPDENGVQSIQSGPVGLCGWFADGV
jgi:hypothetical protein